MRTKAPAFGERRTSQESSLAVTQIPTGCWLVVRKTLVESVDLILGLSIRDSIEQRAG